MKNQSLVFSLLFMFLLAACSNDDDELKEHIIYKSNPEITISTHGDTVYIKGYNICTSVNKSKGKLPDSIAAEFSLDKKYIYVTYKAVVESSEILGEDYLFSSPLNTEMEGYKDPELSGRGCIQSGYVTENKRYGNISTYFVNVTREVGGEVMNLWLPYPPEDIYWKCRLIDASEI